MHDKKNSAELETYSPKKDKTPTIGEEIYLHDTFAKLLITKVNEIAPDSFGMYSVEADDGNTYFIREYSGSIWMTLDLT